MSASGFGNLLFYVIGRMLEGPLSGLDAVLKTCDIGNSCYLPERSKVGDVVWHTTNRTSDTLKAVSVAVTNTHHRQWGEAGFLRADNAMGGLVMRWNSFCNGMSNNLANFMLAYSSPGQEFYRATQSLDDISPLGVFLN
jgi:hypothetical protein